MSKAKGPFNPVDHKKGCFSPLDIGSYLCRLFLRKKLMKVRYRLDPLIKIRQIELFIR